MWGEVVVVMVVVVVVVVVVEEEERRRRRRRRAGAGGCEAAEVELRHRGAVECGVCDGEQNQGGADEVGDTHVCLWGALCLDCSVRCVSAFPFIHDYGQKAGRQETHTHVSSCF
jgi:hypothetical protein